MFSDPSGKQIQTDIFYPTLQVDLKFSKKMTFEEATLTCHQLGGMMPLPRNFQEIEGLTALANESKTTDSGREECKTHWIPIVQKEEANSKQDNQEYEWVHYQFNVNGSSNKTVRFLPWQLGQPNGLEFQQCVVTAPETQLYYDVDCKETHCFFCSVCKQLHFFFNHYINFIIALVLDIQ